MGLFSFITKPFKKVASWFKGSSSKVDYGSAISGLGSSALNYVGSKQGLSNQFLYNSLLQSKGQDWSTMMASTAHQLEVADMRKAGLNPILSATGGSGASAPGATGGSVGLPDYNLDEGLSTALQYRQQKNLDKSTHYDNELKKAQKGLVNEQEHNAYQEGLNLFDTREYIRTQIDDLRNQIENRDKTTAAMIKRYDTMNDVDKINAASNQVSASAAAHKNNVEAVGVGYDNKKRANEALYYGSGIGKRTQTAKEFVKNIPIIGKFAY